MPADQISLRFAGDRIAEHFARAGDLQVACLAMAARAQGIPRTVTETARPDQTPLPMLRLDLPTQAAYCSQGRIFVGPPGAPREACQHLNRSAVLLATHKLAAKLVLQTMGYSTPVGELFSAQDVERAVEWFTKAGRPVCVKPCSGSLGVGVFPAVETLDQFRAAFEAVAACRSQVLVEEHVCFPHLTGNPNTPDCATFRFFFIKPLVVGVRMDLPANVIGDGVSSIARLLDCKNEQKRRLTGQPAVPLDERAMEALRGQGLAAGDVPEAGRRVYLRRVSNSSQSGDSHTFPAGLHPSYAQEIAGMCNLIHGLKIAAVDTMIGDHTIPCRPDGYRIIEFNSSPGMVHFHFPWEGKPHDIASHIVAMLRLGEDWHRAMAAE